MTLPGLEHFDTWQLVALAAAVGWASGIRLYAVLFVLGGLGYLHWIELPGGLAALAHPWVLAASGFMAKLRAAGHFISDALGRAPVSRVARALDAKSLQPVAL